MTYFYINYYLTFSLDIKKLVTILFQTLNYLDTKQLDDNNNQKTQ